MKSKLFAKILENDYNKPYKGQNWSKSHQDQLTLEKEGIYALSKL